MTTFSFATVQCNGEGLPTGGKGAPSCKLCSASGRKSFNTHIKTLFLIEFYDINPNKGDFFACLIRSKQRQLLTWMNYLLLHTLLCFMVLAVVHSVVSRLSYHTVHTCCM